MHPVSPIFHPAIVWTICRCLLSSGMHGAGQTSARRNVGGFTVKVLVKILVTVLFLQFTGCAAMFHGTNDQVTVVSTDPDAKLFVDDFYVGKGSGTVTLHRNTTHT